MLMLISLEMFLDKRIKKFVSDVKKCDFQLTSNFLNPLGRRPQPDSRGSTPTLDNGKYSNAQSIPAVGGGVYSMAHGDRCFTTDSAGREIRPRCKDYDGEESKLDHNPVSNTITGQ